MSNGMHPSPPVMTGWQYIVWSAMNSLFTLATLVVTSLGANWALDAKRQSQENDQRIKGVEMRVYDIQKGHRVIIGAPPPPPPTDG